LAQKKRSKVKHATMAARRRQQSADAPLSGEGASRYSLRLYVAGTNQNSSIAIENLMRLRDSELRNRCDVQIVDIYQQPELAARDGVIAAPMLVKFDPGPRIIFIGDLSDSARLLAGLGIRPKQMNVGISTSKKQ
jgi:circadian clock protein KaiB